MVLFPSLTQPQIEGVSYNWKEKRNKKGISISTAKVAGSKFKAVRGKMLVKGSVASLIAIIEDLPNCSNWAKMCKRSRIEERVSASEKYVYVYNDTPFPIIDRDVYTHVVWTRDPKSQRVSMTSRAKQGGPAKTKAIRVVDAVSQWHFTPNDDGTTTVESFAHIDPNGVTPAWLSNLLLIGTPYRMMKKMRTIIESGVYDDTPVPMLDQLQPSYKDPTKRTY